MEKVIEGRRKVKGVTTVQVPNEVPKYLAIGNAHSGELIIDYAKNSYAIHLELNLTGRQAYYTALNLGLTPQPFIVTMKKSLYGTI